MYLSGKGASSGDRKLTAAKATLNPNATEFVPFALRSPTAGTTSVEASSKFAISTPGKGILDRSESSVSNNSDDEAQQYWRNQLPDDITPDFKVMGIDDTHTQGINSLPFSSLSLTDINEGPRYSASTGSGFMLKEQQGLSPRPVNGNSHAEQMRYPVSSYGEYPSPTGFHPSLAKPWDQQFVNNDQLLAREVTDGGNQKHGLLADLSNEQLLMDSAEVNPLEFLASQFPGFAAESLAEVYFANGGDLNITIEMLTQLELQVDGGLNHTLNSKASSSPNLNSMDFPALSARDGQNDLANFAGDGHHQNGPGSPYRSSEKQGPSLFRSNSFIPSRGATDFASAVRKMAPQPQESSMWKYERNGSSDASIGSSRSSQVLASSYNNGQGRGIYSDRLQSRGSTRAAPLWLETGEAVANMYSEMREEARDHARVRNVYFEQVCLCILEG
ncbi:hypothetical protein ACS0TY_022485 [Phlomoides rotata]